MLLLTGSTHTFPIAFDHILLPSVQTAPEHHSYPEKGKIYERTNIVVGVMKKQNKCSCQKWRGRIGAKEGRIFSNKKAVGNCTGILLNKFHTIIYTTADIPIM